MTNVAQAACMSLTHQASKLLGLWLLSDYCSHRAFLMVTRGYRIGRYDRDRIARDLAGLRSGHAKEERGWG